MQRTTSSSGGRGYLSPSINLAIAGVSLTITIGDTTVTDARGNMTTLVYYPTGSAAGSVSLLHTATRPAIGEGTPVYAFDYDAAGKMADMTGPTGIVTHNDYDAGENPIATTLDYGTGSGHLNLKTQFGYTLDGDPNMTTDPRGALTVSSYDADRRKSEDDHHDGDLTHPLNAAGKTLYDPIGRVTDNQVGTSFTGSTVNTWLTVKHTTYTPTSKVATVTDADSRTTTTVYDDGDRVLTVTDPISRATRFNYCTVNDLPNCAANQVDKEIRAWTSGNSCAVSGTLQECYRRVTYGADGEQATIKDANGNTTIYGYDGWNRPNLTTFPDGTTEQIPVSGGYAANGNVLQRINRNGQTLNYTYNALNWMTQKVSPSPTVTTSSYEPDWMGLAKRGDVSNAHLEIQAVSPKRAALPITDTGYRSQFLSPRLVEQAGGAVAYARAWLDEAAKAPAWKKRQESSRQLSLF